MKSSSKSASAVQTVLRQHAEDEFKRELEALAESDDKPRPPKWRLSPWAVATYPKLRTWERKARDSRESRVKVFTTFAWGCRAA